MIYPSQMELKVLHCNGINYRSWQYGGVEVSPGIVLWEFVFWFNSNYAAFNLSNLDFPPVPLKSHAYFFLARNNLSHHYGWKRSIMDHAQNELCFSPIWYHVGSYNYHPVQCSTTVLLFWLNDHISLFLQASHLCEKAKTLCGIVV